MIRKILPHRSFLLLALLVGGAGAFVARGMIDQGSLRLASMRRGLPNRRIRTSICHDRPPPTHSLLRRGEGGGGGGGKGRAGRLDSKASSSTAANGREGGEGWIPEGDWVRYLAAMAGSGAALGPFLDGYHSAFGVLAYTNPISVVIGDVQVVVTDWWVPAMFALAAVILGVSYPILDTIFKVGEDEKRPSGPAVLACIGCFCLQYYISGFLFSLGASVTSLTVFLAATAAACIAAFDRTPTGAVMAVVTGLAGPLVELGLLIAWPQATGYTLYHYTTPDFAEAIPLWIGWVYACGAPAVGNLGRAVFHALKSRDD